MSPRLAVLDISLPRAKLGRGRGFHAVPMRIAPFQVQVESWQGTGQLDGLKRPKQGVISMLALS